MISEHTLYEHYHIVADSGQKALRIDKFLIVRLPNLTRNKIQQGVKEGYVKVNDQVISKPSHKILPNDQISVNFLTPPRNDVIIPENIPLDIVMEDEHILIINKPAGMVVHPAYKNWTGTLVNALEYRYQNLPNMKSNTGRPGLVHRIDKDTSGLLIIAKTQEAMDGLSKQFFDHSIDRMYFALVWGCPKQSCGTIDVRLGRSLKDHRVVTAFTNDSLGKHAITHYEVLKDLKYVSLVKCTLETGRTHQIRAHMKYMGHPLFNDVTYGGNQILKGTIFSKYKQFIHNCFEIMPRQALHAKTLGFQHPVTKKRIFVESDLTQDFKQLIEKWEKYITN